MADRILVSTETLIKWAENLNTIQSELSFIADSLMGIFAEEGSGGDLSYRTNVVLHNGARISGQSAEEVVASLRNAAVKTGADAAEVAEGLIRAAELFDEAENWMLKSAVDSARVFADNSIKLSALSASSSKQELAAGDVAVAPSAEIARVNANQYASLKDYASGKDAVDPEVFDTSRIKNVYYIYGYPKGWVNSKIGHTAILMVDENGNGFHYCFYADGQVGVLYLNKRQVNEFYNTGYIPGQTCSGGFTSGAYYGKDDRRYHEIVDLQLGAEKSYNVYDRCLRYFDQAVNNGGKLEYSQFGNNCDDLAYMALTGKKSINIIPKNTFDSLRRVTWICTGKDGYRKLGNEIPECYK